MIVLKRKIISLVLVLSLLVSLCTSFSFAAEIDTPSCSCGNVNSDLSVHADSCSRKAYCRSLSEKSAEELYAAWSEIPEDVRAFVLVYLSWTNQAKHQALSELLKNFTEPETPEDPEIPAEEEEEGCRCEEKSTYGSISHEDNCPYHFINLSVEDEYVVYVTMEKEAQNAALSLLDESKKAELEAYVAEHPYASTVSEDGVSVTAMDVPQGATVTAEVVDRELTESLLPSITLANQVNISLDIKVYDANGTPWDPENGSQVMVKVAIPETTTGQKSDIIHVLDTVSVIEDGIADGSVKLLDLTYLFKDTDENGEEITLTPVLPDAYTAALAATAELGYEYQIAYEILTGICVDDGYSVFYTDSFSAFSDTNLASGTYFIKWDLNDEDGNGGWSTWKGYWLEKNQDAQRHDYYYDSIGNLKIPSGNTVKLIFVKGSVPLSGTITVYGTLNISVYDGQKVTFWGRKWSGWYENGDKSLEQNQLYYDANNTIYRASGNTGHLINVEQGGTLNIAGLNNATHVVIDGKGIANSGAAIVGSGKVNLDYVTIKNNYKSGVGGAIILQGSGSHTLDYVNVSNCSASNNGGAIHISGSASGTLNSVNISSCSAGAGGGIFNSSSGSFTLNSSTIKDCTGNGLYLGGSGTNTVTSSTISGCTATDGAAILIVSTAGSTTVNSSTITGNKGLNGQLGGTVRSYGNAVSTATFNNCNVYGNSSPQHGGGFYWNAASPSKLTINSCNIYNNSAGSYGGGIFCESVMEIKGTTNIYGNSANIGGGICVNSYAGSATATNSGSDLSLSSSISIYNNTATQNGGGISMNVVKSVSLYDDAAFFIRLNGASIYGNTAASGGGIHIFRNTNGPTYSCAVDLNYGKFETNTASSGNGGGIYTENVDVTIGNPSGSALTISGNKATNGIGGALYSTGSLGSCSITNGTLTSNSAKSGGAVAVSDCFITINGGSITGNSATQFGGAIYATGANAGVTVSGNGSVSSNSAANGGGIYATAGADVSVTGGIISYNSAKGNPGVTTAYSDAASGGVGGGIYVGNGTSSNASSIALSGSSVGLYGNSADFAAADAYASGRYTSVTLPAVKNMNLTGYSGIATGWYEDYATNDSGYAYGLQNGSEAERYAKARNTYEVANASGVTKYTAVTLGTSKQGYGNLTVKKTGDSIDPDQVFLFEITGKDLSMVISITGTGSVTVYELPDGAYTVTELTDWSWRYTPQSGTQSTTISGTNVNPTLTFHNTKTDNDYLSATDGRINAKG